jgi:hypothetical protein
VLAYNLEWFGGAVHNSAGFAASWGAFPALTGYYAQHWSISLAAVVFAVAAFGLSWAQRTLSTPARWLRRTAHDVTLTARTEAGAPITLAAGDVLRPLEVALKALSWSLVAVAVAVVLAAR